MDQIIKTIFGKLFREARDNKKISRANLSHRLGISHKTIQSWEMGRTFIEDLSLIPAIEEQLEIDLSELIKTAISTASVKGDLQKPGPLKIKHRQVEKSETGIPTDAFLNTSGVPILTMREAIGPLHKLRKKKRDYSFIPCSWGRKKSSSLIAVRMPDSSLEPLVPRGAIVVIDNRPVDPEKLIGKIVLVSRPKGDGRIRVLRRLKDDTGYEAGVTKKSGRGSFSLNLDSGAHQIIGPAIGSIQPL